MRSHSAYHNIMLVIIWMIRYEGRLSELFCGLLCPTVVYSNTQMHMRNAACSITCCHRHLLVRAASVV